MLGSLPEAVIMGALVLGAVVLVYLALNRRPDWLLLGVTGLVELGAVVVLVATIGQFVTGSHDGLGALDGAQTATLIGYLVVAVVALPMGFVWALAEEGRGALAALVIVCLTEAFLIARALQVVQA